MAAALGQFGIELDRGADDVTAPSMAADRDGEVGGVTGAQGHNGQRSGRRRVEEVRDRIDDVAAAVVQRIRGVLVRLVPSPPVIAHLARVGLDHGILDRMRVGIADHFGWAVAVTASADHEVVDRRRLELVEPGVTAAPIHYESHRLDDAGTAALVEEVRASVARATSASLDELAAALPDPVVDLPPQLAAGLPDGHRCPAAHPVRGPRRRHHVSPGAGRAGPRS